MSLILYKCEPSPPARAAMMITEFLNKPVKFVEIDLLNKQHLDPSFVKKNPLHSIPVLEDGDLYLTDSHAILAYLVDVYGTDESLYPKDPKKRALVNQKLYFDNGYLFTRLKNVSYSVLFEGLEKPTQKHLADISEAYGYLEEFLTLNKWLAGDQMTIADISAINSATGLHHILPINSQKYPKLQNWISTLVEKPFYKKQSAPGNEVFRKLLEEKLKA